MVIIYYNKYYELFMLAWSVCPFIATLNVACRHVGMYTYNLLWKLTELSTGRGTLVKASLFKCAKYHTESCSVEQCMCYDYYHDPYYYYRAAFISVIRNGCVPPIVMHWATWKHSSKYLVFTRVS